MLVCLRERERERERERGVVCKLTQKSVIGFIKLKTTRYLVKLLLTEALLSSLPGQMARHLRD